MSKKPQLLLGDLAGRAVITMDEVGDLLGISHGATIMAVQRGEIPILRIGRRVLVPVPALLLMLLCVTDAPRFLRDVGAEDLPRLINWLTGAGAAK
jgi:excisionase family DNA binding protein